MDDIFDIPATLGLSTDSSDYSEEGEFVEENDSQNVSLKSQTKQDQLINFEEEEEEEEEHEFRLTLTSQNALNNEEQATTEENEEQATTVTSDHEQSLADSNQFEEEKKEQQANHAKEQQPNTPKEEQLPHKSFEIAETLDDTQGESQASQIF